MTSLGQGGKQLEEGGCLCCTPPSPPSPPFPGFILSLPPLSSLSSASLLPDSLRPHAFVSLSTEIAVSAYHSGTLMQQCSY
eukprot:10114-Rhodomonas_salina.3